MRRLLSSATLCLAALGLAACDPATDAKHHGTSGTSGAGAAAPAPLSKVEKVDIVLSVDNSRSMADKQQILAHALSDLLSSLTNPPCLDPSGARAPDQPATGGDACPAGSARTHAPIDDIHIGVITSSIGGFGSDACPNSEITTCPGGATNTSNNDMAHLVTRKDPCVGGELTTYENKGFLAWDPAQRLLPPGEGDAAKLAEGVEQIVLGAGQIGCGYEPPLESWYRFLVDPEPYDHLEIDDEGSVDPVGLDKVLLAQRAAFLRPDSLLAILMLSDENDCSIKEYGKFYLAAQQRDPNNTGKNFYLPRARQECATDPNDPCCKSCSVDPGDCPADPSCGMHDSKTDDVNLRCWDQKRRFGVDFLYPIDRYVQGLSSALVPNRQGALVDNPIFSDLVPGDGDSKIRDPGLVILTAIVGVPWQDLARDPSDLTKGYKSAEELAHAHDGITTWDVILGEPSEYVLPLDPHMIATTEPRSGTNPITGTPMAPPGSPAGSDPINGHEWSIGTKNNLPVAKDDLQYACIFDLPEPKDCSPMANNVSCDCTDPVNDNPLCELNPNTDDRTLQVRAKAYPGLRQLEAIRDLGPNGIAASICPAQQADPTSTDYAYRPAIRALLERLSPRLQPEQ